MEKCGGRAGFLKAGAALLLFTVILSVVNVTPAYAQGRPLRLMLGISTPVTYDTSGSSSEIYGGDRAMLIAGGVSYDVKQGQENPAGGRGLVYSVYLNGGSTANILGANAGYAGMGICARYEQSFRLYYGGGIGRYRQKTPNYRFYGEFTDKDAVRTDTGGKVFIGYQGRGSFFGQIEATLLPEINGDNLSNVALLLGLRL